MRRIIGKNAARDRLEAGAARAGGACSAAGPLADSTSWTVPGGVRRPLDPYGSATRPDVPPDPDRASGGAAIGRPPKPAEPAAGGDQRQSAYPSVPEDLSWSCTLAGHALKAEARDQQLREQLERAGLPATAFPRLATVLDDLLARLAVAGTIVEAVTVECRSDVLLLRIDDTSGQLAALPQVDAPFLEVLALDHGQFCQPGRRCTWATLPCGAG